jgi:glutamate-1-semialdehyde 2,1-aminomutase
MSIGGAHKPAGTQRNFARSRQLSAEIAGYIPGGVDSPFRTFAEVGGHTIFFNRASGSKLFDVDGNEYIDYLGAWGPAILGHCHPDVVTATQEAIAMAPVFGAPHELELAAAKALTRLIPSMQKVRFVNSGTEAVMSAVRLARGFKRRDLIIMFEGCYHGHSDSVLASRSHFSSAGIPANSAHNTLLVPYNDISALQAALHEHAASVAAVIIEPVAGSMGVIVPPVEYLQAVADACKKHDVLFVLDEVLTGLRVARGGAQALYEIAPDLTCFGKALGGGMPIGAYGGRAEIMDRLLPDGDVYQAGTFSGNPATLAATVRTLELLDDEAVYARMETRADQLFQGLARAADLAGIDVQLQRAGSMFSILFAPHAVCNYKDSLAIDPRRFGKFFHNLLNHGVYLPPSSVDAACLSAAHTEQDIEETIRVCADAFNTLLL